MALGRKKKKDGLIGIFDTVVDQPLRKSKSTQPPAFKPSMLGTPCLRKLYYSYNRVLEDYGLPLNVLRICRLGDAIHEMLTEIFQKAGVLVEYRDENGQIPTCKFTGKPDIEFPLKDATLELSAKIDGVFIIDGKLWLGEYKSSNSFGYGKLKAPKPEHLIQGVCYLYVFNRALKEGKFSHIKELDGFEKAEGVRFLYVNKDTSTMKEFVITEQNQVFIEIINKMTAVKEHINNNTLPPKTEDWCKSCNWRDKCKQNYKI